MLECVVNVSEGRDVATLRTIAAAVGRNLIDLHRDSDHHRSVFTLAGEDELVEAAARDLATAVVGAVDITRHVGAHPRIGALDVVPFVALEGQPLADGPLKRSVEARDRFAAWAASHLGLPCFCYGPEQSLPEVRRGAWRDIQPDRGPNRPHPTAGAVAVGARRVLVAYNLWLAEPDLSTARRIASEIRGPDLRTLGLALGTAAQVSCNLIAPWSLGPAQAYDAVAARAAIDHAELVGLVPASILDATPEQRWRQLDLDPSRTIEARLKRPPTLTESGLG